MPLHPNASICSDHPNGHCEQRFALSVACTECGKPADSLHFVPWFTDRSHTRLEFGCKRHDPGGYWIMLSSLEHHPGRWLAHLSEKNYRPDRLLSRWLVEQTGVKVVPSYQG